MIRVQPDADKSILLAGNANELWREEDLDDVADAVEEAPPGSILVADLEVTGFVVKHGLEAAKRAGLPVVLDPSPASRFDEALYSLIDYITPNASEARQLTGISVKSPEDAFRAGEAFLERGIRTALVKLGKGGCTVVSRSIREHVESRKIEPVDTTSFGDTFAGGLAAALLHGYPLEKAARFAVAAVALSATRYGAQESYPSREELERWHDDAIEGQIWELSGNGRPGTTLRGSSSNPNSQIQSLLSCQLWKN